MVSGGIYANMTYKDANGNNIATTIKNVISDLNLTANYQRTWSIHSMELTMYSFSNTVSIGSSLSSLFPDAPAPAVT